MKPFEALHCYRVIGLAGVERIPHLSGSKTSYAKICYSIFLHPLSLQTAYKKC